MELALWLSGFVFLVPAILVGSATGQSQYKVTLEKLAPCNEKTDTLADISGLKVVKLNQTSVGLRGKILLHEDVSEDTTIKLAIHKFSLGTWVQVPMSFPAHNVCEFVKKDTTYFPNLLRNSNIPKQCPFSKGTYEIGNSIITAKKLPAYLPKGCFRVDITLTNDKLKQPSCYSIHAKVSGSGLGANPACH